MTKIIAIGGGEIGKPGFKTETTAIDKEIIALTNKKNPKLLFIPTASNDSQGYCDCVEKHFGKKLGCKIDYLKLIEEKRTKSEIKNKILNTDIIYIGGGNTLKMMTIWKKYNIPQYLNQAKNKGIVLSGLSAGSICWFKYGNSDSRKFTSKSNKLIKVTGLDFINALHCPHFDFEKNREKDLKRMMKTTYKIPALALDNCCALEIIDNEYRVIKSKTNAKAYKTYWKNNKYYKVEIKSTKNFQPLTKLLSK